MENNKKLSIKQIKPTVVISECEQAIAKYQLSTLLDKAKPHFKSLTDDEQDLMWAGLIKLGEALTFCRDKNNSYLKQSGIIDSAIKFANARNYFIHHHVYYDYLKLNTRMNETVANLPKINLLQLQLKKLKDSSLELLTKEIKSGANDYPFDYARQVEVLIAEFNKLKQTLETINSNQNSINITLEVKLDNRVRNILTIILDLTGEGAANTYNSKFCDEEKSKVKDINKKFIDRYDEFAELFTSIKIFRNALSHLDNSLEPPYKNASQMLEFARDLQKIDVLGYTNELKNAFLAQAIDEKEDFSLEMLKAGQSLKAKFKKPEAKEIKDEEILEQPSSGILGKKRGYEEELDISVQKPQATDSPKPPAAKKAKIENKEEETKETTSENINEYPFSLFSKYGSTSEEEEKSSQSEEDILSISNRPKPK